MKIKLRKLILPYLYLILGICSACIGIDGFLMPSGFIDGGVTGVSMLIARLSSVPLFVLIFAINLPFLLLGLFQLGPKFASRTFIAISGLSVCLAFSHVPELTSDKLLGAIFGGMFLGAGIGLSIRGGGVLDGTEIFALLISRKSGIGVGNVILLCNIFIFSVAAWMLGIEPALYSILTYYAASKTIDFLVYGVEEYCAVTIVSSKSEELRSALLEILGRGITRFHGRGGRSDSELDILLSVVTRLEIPRIKAIVQEVDNGAFLTVHQLSDVRGGFVTSRAVDRIKYGEIL